MVFGALYFNVAINTSPRIQRHQVILDFYSSSHRGCARTHCEFQMLFFSGMDRSWWWVSWCPGGKRIAEADFPYSNPEQAGALKKKKKRKKSTFVHLLPRQLQSAHKPNLEGSARPARYCMCTVLFFFFYSNGWERWGVFFVPFSGSPLNRAAPGCVFGPLHIFNFTYLKSSTVSLWLSNHYYAHYNL